MMGSLAPELRRVLERALTTIEAGVAGDHPESRLDDAELQPLSQLSLRIGAAYPEHG